MINTRFESICDVTIICLFLSLFYQEKETYITPKQLAEGNSGTAVMCGKKVSHLKFFRLINDFIVHNKLVQEA